MLDFIALLRRWLRQSSARSVKDATPKKLKALLGSCPLCATSLDGHGWVLFATAAAQSNVDQLTTFIYAAQEKDWPSLRRFRDWKVSENNLEVFLILCGSSGGALVMVLSPFELYANDEVVLVERLTVDAVLNGLLLVAPEERHRFGNAAQPTDQVGVY